MPPAADLLPGPRSPTRTTPTAAAPTPRERLSSRLHGRRTGRGQGPPRALPHVLVCGLEGKPRGFHALRPGDGRGLRLPGLTGPGNHAADRVGIARSGPVAEQPDGGARSRPVSPL